MIHWLPWGADAFARASRERRPVLLSITAAWCRACHEMDRTTYADAAVAALIGDRFVPVRVDADRRPDINERYNLGGWPTTAFLTAGGALITGGTFVPVDRMAGVLMQVAAAAAAAEDAAEHAAEDAAENAEYAEHAAEHAEHGAEHAAEYAEHAAEYAEHAAEYAEHGAEHGAEHAEHAAEDAAENAEYAEGAPHAGQADLLGDLQIDESVFGTFDAQHGGFGGAPKFPHAAPLQLAMARFRETGDDRWRHIVERTLDAMADHLWDRDGGGFFRYAAARDWQLPQDEKLLETNASLLRVYAEAAIVFGRDADRDRCAAIAAFITTSLRAETGGYYGSDAERVLYADSNAAAAGALLGAATVLDDSALAQEALASFERVILLCYKPGLGVAHYFDGSARVRGLLGDQVATIAALLDAYDVSDLEPYRMMAEELGHIMVRDAWDAAAGGFFDRAPGPEDVGLLRGRRKPFVANAEAAAALARLSRLEPRKGFPDPAAFRDYAHGALAAAGRQMTGQGPLAAHYALARRLLID